jgi:hypothetical protein
MRDTCQIPKVLLLSATLLLLLLSGCTGEEPLPSVPLPRSMKGYELYSWQSGKAWRFTLVTGTNRLKTIAEITSREDVVEGDWVKITVEGAPDLKAALHRLPPGSQVVWWGARDLSPGSVIPRARLDLPPEQLVQEIRSHCAGLGIQLEVSR